jgi:hypothetical protein
VDQIVNADTGKLLKNWETGLAKVLNSIPGSSKYVILRSANLVALGIFIFVRSDNVELIRKVQVDNVKCGLGGLSR